MKLVILLSLVSFTVGSIERDGKLFSLFSVVQFKNEPCKTDKSVQGVISDYRNGTCFTSTECTDKGGRASGNCAAG